MKVQSNYLAKQIDEVNKLIIEQLNDFKGGKSLTWNNIEAGMPFNPLSERFYTGFNFLSLTVFCKKHKKKHANFATFKQINDAGGKVNKGVSSLPIFYKNRTWYMQGEKTTYESIKEKYSSYSG